MYDVPVLAKLEGRAVQLEIGETNPLKLPEGHEGSPVGPAVIIYTSRSAE
jgi:hypothetical protein